MIEIDPSVTSLLPGKNIERGLMNLRAQIQAAARRKWEAGEAYPQSMGKAGRMEPAAIPLTAEDLEL